MEICTIFFLLILFVNFLETKALSEWWEHSPVVELTNDNFFDYVGKDKYVVVKFFTKWCHYCRKMSPEYDKLYEYYKGKRDDLIIARVECSDNEYLAIQYNIPSYPTLAMFNPKETKIKRKFKDDRKLDRFISWIEKFAPRKIKGKKKNDNDIKYKKSENKNNEKISENMNTSNASSSAPTLESEHLINEHISKLSIHQNDTHGLSDEVEFIKREIMNLRTRTAFLEKEIKINHPKPIKKKVIKQTDKQQKEQKEVKSKSNKQMRIKHEPLFSFHLMIAIALLISITIGGVLTLKRIIIPSNLKDN